MKIFLKVYKSYNCNKGQLDDSDYGGDDYEEQVELEEMFNISH